MITLEGKFFDENSLREINNLARFLISSLVVV